MKHGISVDDTLDFALYLVKAIDKCLDPCKDSINYVCRWCGTKRRRNGYRHRKLCPVPKALSLLTKAIDIRPESSTIIKLLRMKQSSDASDRHSVRHISIAGDRR